MADQPVDTSQLPLSNRTVPPDPSAGGVLPPPGGPIDPAALMGQLATQYQMPAMAALSTTAGNMAPLAEPQAIPKMGLAQEPWMRMQPVTGQGVGHGLLNLLEDVGRGALMAGASTRQGQALQNAAYGPGIRKYAAERQQKAQQLEALKNQAGAYGGEAESASRAIGGMGELQWHQGMLDINAQKNLIAQQKANTYQQSVENRLATEMKGLDIKQLMAGSTMELNKARIILDKALASVAPQRIDLGYYDVDANNATRQAVANVESQLGLIKTHPLLNMLDQMMGTSMMPSAPQAPGGAQPVGGQTPLPPRQSGKQGKGGGGMVTVQVPGHPPGQIPANKLKAFQAKYPNAQVSQ